MIDDIILHDRWRYLCQKCLLIPIEVIFIAFDRKFPKFRMEGKWLGHFSEIPTENWGVRFEVVLSFQLVRTKRNVAYH